MHSQEFSIFNLHHVSNQEIKKIQIAPSFLLDAGVWVMVFFQVPGLQNTGNSFSDHTFKSYGSCLTGIHHKLFIDTEAAL